MARTLGLEPRPAVLETDMLPITPSPYMVSPMRLERMTSALSERLSKPTDIRDN